MSFNGLWCYSRGSLKERGWFVGLSRTEWFVTSLTGDGLRRYPRKYRAVPDAIEPGEVDCYIT